jgi:phosphoribosyl-ATP pyrophosphohydrolase/phosphoribosyl-AMP cyclohydrolase
MTETNIDFLLTLESVINERKNASVDESYTAQLFASGPLRIAQKIGEEGVELALAGAQRNSKEIVAESADLLFHMLVLLSDNELSLTDVTRELKNRHR